MGLAHQPGQGGGRPGSVWGWRSKGSLDSGWFPHSASCSRDLAAGALQGPIGQRAEPSASSLPWAPGGACPGPSAPGCCFCFAPSAFFSLLLVPPCLSPRPPAPIPPVLTLIQSSSPAGLQTLPRSLGRQSRTPASPESGAPGLCTPFNAHVRLSPSHPSRGPHLAGVLGFPAVNRFPLPLGICSGFSSRSLFLGGGGALRVEEARLASLFVRRLWGEALGSCCQRSFCPSPGRAVVSSRWWGRNCL